MDDLLKQITDKTGISVEKAKEVVETVMNFLGDKLPDPVAAQVNKFLAGGGEGGGGLGDMMDKGKDMLGGLMGGGDK
jgi:hypothetical protein